ncbi:DUF3526 domain-containing protein [Flagellimonas pacifica]|uniref:ABC-2 type transport system permease protein n=1 Tax=Flagellimonas pacifica TaxID=1247520 RepID=A0A285MG24_9FLAO|nr:DUF3526 domain-containing protein [Allomuricauda parva]SNY95427.1 ABC-2 type transport system permease protein [Allomuricauda parva]
MKTSIRIAKKEIKIALREKLVLALSCIILVLLGISLYTGAIAYQQQQEAITKAQKEKREEWLGQGDKHPHIAAHFGTFIFKPKTVLSLFDFGLDTYTGTSVYLEAHYQHQFMFRPAQDHSSMIRFGELSAALVLQILMPLLIIFLAYASFTREKERGTLRLLSSQGITLTSIAWGKIMAYFIILLVILVPFVLGILLLSYLLKTPDTITDLGIRIVLLGAAYMAYIFMFIVLSVLVSLKSSISRNALLTLLTCWILFTIIIPKTVANLGESLYPLPSMKIYKEAILKDKKDGLDGKTPRAVRMAQLEKELLTKYKVDSVQQLPFNFDGVKMQAGEEYGDKVYDVHWGRLLDLFNKQNKLGSYASLLNPYIALRNISMGFSATDLNTSVDFQKKVENYRRVFIKKMNDDMAQNSKYGEFYEYSVGLDMWKSVEDFEYNTPSIYATLKKYTLELTSLFCWTVVLILLLNYITRKTKPTNG